MHAAIKIRLEGLRRLAGIGDHIGQSSEDQAVVFLREAFPGQVAASARVGAIALLELTDEPESRFQWIGGAEALRVLIGCLLAIDSVGATDRARAFQTIAAPLELLPVYRLSVGTAAEGVPPAIDALLSRLRRDGDRTSSAA
jgi:hypothetical protein